MRCISYESEFGTLNRIVGSLSILSFAISYYFCWVLLNEYYNINKKTPNPTTTTSITSTPVTSTANIFKILLLLSAITLILVTWFRNFGNEDPISLESKGITMAVGVFLGSAIAMVILSGLHVRSHIYNNVSNVEGYGTLTMIVLGGLSIRIGIDIYQFIISPYVIYFITDYNEDPFFSVAREVVTEFLPMVIHLRNIPKKQTKEEFAKSVDIRTTSQLILQCLIASLRVTSGGFVISTTPSDLPVTILIARLFAFWATIDLICLMVSICSSLVQLMYHYFNHSLPQHSSNKIHFHKSMAYMLLIDALTHIGCHIATWYKEPNISIGGNKIYALNNVPVVTGILMTVCMVVAIIGGSFRQTKYGLRIHHISAATMIVWFAFHGSAKIIGYPYGDYSIIVTAILLAIIYTFHLIWKPIMYATIKNIETKGKYLCLDLELPNAYPPHAGSFILLYHPYSMLSHGHPFTVFVKPNHCNNAGGIIISMVIRIIGSFTTGLSVLKDGIQVPFHGFYQSSFNSGLSEIRRRFSSSNTDNKSNLFLYGSGTGVTTCLSVYFHILKNTYGDAEKINNLYLFFTTNDQILLEHVVGLLDSNNNSTMQLNCNVYLIFAKPIPPKDSKNQTTDSTKPTTDSTKPITDSTKPITDSTNPPKDSTNPPKDSTNPPNDSTNPPNDSTNPKDSKNPTTDSTNPPIEPTKKLNILRNYEGNIGEIIKSDSEENIIGIKPFYSKNKGPGEKFHSFIFVGASNMESKQHLWNDISDIVVYTEGF
ncbi:pleckstrin (PH) domain-containing protein [Tieghemostelium lacteum]|uniref:Pleckstrin (PH) domain-containing protein n=1 Tax=Tieghemostelium lacteum TaxID=361077 RepID=A0A151ZCK3_TIELA|nr:pleckstrin (PH) domain-containing protein [Tieghemostelium lacteum]|eukprot:KYQ91655.1 pleckstrin (PH) domain-containing protein [Tieghemostelium lacteum]